ncbi:hypothetical protein [Rhizobium leguminosarum]|uniref:Uncharacterized protein n=1 Tax=Rhizobium phage RHEph01 TaxID=1220601 RepID=L7TMM7_9CAUD|nr:hypothetical protein [Rhizobium leguminosarum]YP_009783940.1 hypothetical protein HOQ88_gp55 [Rhizobium phage RHEph01]AGC35549.1 hypothetical protein RHEph01_gp039 [Rhizobium phage RHEph01]MBB4345216.1 hypothetical protein [Rhizobium leguminosarum]MBB6298287.1 hypothetical protein [Rhizobium leguminosarum]
MATQNYSIETDDWTAVSTAEATVIVKNESVFDAYIAVAPNSAALASVKGHILPRGDAWPFINLGANKVFVKRNEKTQPLAISVSAY